MKKTNLQNKCISEERKSYHSEGVEENSPNLETEMSIQTQETYRTWNRQD